MYQGFAVDFENGYETALEVYCKTEVARYSAFVDIPRDATVF
jgi:hypothetical protein